MKYVGKIFSVNGGSFFEVINYTHNDVYIVKKFGFNGECYGTYTEAELEDLILNS
jgi:hypothetical protein